MTASAALSGGGPGGASLTSHLADRGILYGRGRFRGMTLLIIRGADDLRLHRRNPTAIPGLSETLGYDRVPVICKLKIRTRQVSEDPQRQRWSVEVTTENDKVLDEPLSIFEWLRAHQLSSCTVVLSTDDKR